MHIGTTKKPQRKKGLLFLIITTFVIIGVLLIPAPKKGVSDSDAKEKTWGDVIMKFFQKDTTAIYPTRRKYKLCRDNRVGVKTCRPDGVVITVRIQEYHDGFFAFVASWKEGGVFKKRALFRWDKIANPNHGRWHQLGSSHPGSGTWRFETPGKDGVFHGWYKIKGKKSMMSLEPT